MHRDSTVAPRPAWRLLFAATLAILGQLGIFAAPLALAREETSALAHAEQSGTSLHHGHDGATCAACATLSLQASIHVVPPISSGAISSLVLFGSFARPLTDPQLLPNSCRAPPREA